MYQCSLRIPLSAVLLPTALQPIRVKGHLTRQEADEQPRAKLGKCVHLCGPHVRFNCFYYSTVYFVLFFNSAWPKLSSPFCLTWDSGKRHDEVFNAGVLS